MLKRKNIIKMLGMGSLCLFLLGCSEESFLVQEDSSTIVLEEEVILSLKEKEELNNLQNSNNEQPMLLKEVGEQGTANGEQNELVSHDMAGNNSGEEKIVVHICGAVNQPGVYSLLEGQRLYEGIEEAGGFRQDAERDYLNQALLLEDGMKIIVPTKEEVEKSAKAEDNLSPQEETARNGGKDIYVQKKEFSEELAVEDGYFQKKDGNGKSESVNQSGKVDLNTADESLLCTLPGIGESRAKSILAYREEHGLFQEPEDIMKVSGIKEAAYEKIKDYVMVSD